MDREIERACPRLVGGAEGAMVRCSPWNGVGLSPSNVNVFDV